MFSSSTQSFSGKDSTYVGFFPSRWRHFHLQRWKNLPPCPTGVDFLKELVVEIAYLALLCHSSRWEDSHPTLKNQPFRPVEKNMEKSHGVSLPVEWMLNDVGCMFLFCRKVQPFNDWSVCSLRLLCNFNMFIHPGASSHSSALRAFYNFVFPHLAISNLIRSFCSHHSTQTASNQTMRPSTFLSIFVHFC